VFIFRCFLRAFLPRVCAIESHYVAPVARVCPCVAAWRAARNAADNWSPSKKKSREWIDGIVATIMALGIEKPIEPSWRVLV
jgi:hypothetical protein